MTVENVLEAEGRGKYSYDYDHDLLMFKIKGRDYAKSEEYRDLVLDIDEEGFVTGLRLFNASRELDIPREDLENVEDFRFEIVVEDNVLTVRLKFYAGADEPLRGGQNLVRESPEITLKDSRVVCTV